MDGVQRAAQPPARRRAQDQGGAQPEAAADRPAADDGRAHPVPEGELRCRSCSSYHPLLIPLGDGPGDFAFIPRRSAIAEAQAEGQVLWEMKKTAARDAWHEIEPTMRGSARSSHSTSRHTTGGQPWRCRLTTLDLLPADPGPQAGAPLLLPIDTIDEDPEQPRQRVRRRDAGRTGRDDPRARRAPAGLGARAPDAARALDAQLRRPAAARLEAGRQGPRFRPSSTRPPTATTRSSRTSSARA